MRKRSGSIRRAVDLGLRDDLLFKTLWEIGRLEKKLERYDAALAIYTDLAAARESVSRAGLEELAKHYERRERNYAMALEMTRSALALEDSEPLRRREQRLKARLESPRARVIRPRIRSAPNSVSD